jgi:hypothetical protein
MPMLAVAHKSGRALKDHARKSAKSAEIWHESMRVAFWRIFDRENKAGLIFGFAIVRK